jgi:hypothetical protein
MRSLNTDPGYCPDRRPLQALEREITELAAHIHAATCRWLCLVGEFDAREGWASWGCRSCAHWVSWQCSIAPAAAREHVRVARALRDLPLIRAAFGRGRLSYSKVRALTRVGTVTREEELLDLAETATAAQLERLVRAYRGVVRAERAAGGCPERYLSWSHDDDGSLLLRGRLPAEEGALVLEALEAARTSLRAGVSAEGGGGGVSAETAGGDDGSGEDVSAEAPDGEYASAAEGVSAETPVAAGASNADALMLMADSLLAGEAVRRSGAERYQVVVHVDADALRAHGGGDPGNPEERGGERCELAAGQPMAAETARRIACDAGLVALLERAGRPLGVGRKTRALPSALRRALRARDRGCRFPGCTQVRHVDAHHIRHWADGGTTALDNLVQLCRHHHRLLHEGGYSLVRASGDRLIFRRPDGRRVRALPERRRGHPLALRDQYRGPPIHHETCLPGWSGERLDLDLGVAALVAFAPIPEAPGV